MMNWQEFALVFKKGWLGYPFTKFMSSLYLASLSQPLLASSLLMSVAITSRDSERDAYFLDTHKE